MKNATYDVTGIGNAIVDVLAFTDDAFLAAQGLVKGSMQLVDEERAQLLYSRMGQTTECSGGSAANTLAGLASLGGRAAFIGKVRNDQIGAIFTHDLVAVGVHFTTPPAQHGPSTASCLVCVTPDAQRTMSTYLGACGSVSESDIDESLIADSAITYIEGYLWDGEGAKAAIRKAIGAARAHGRKVALTLSDTFCVHRHRSEFLELLNGNIDILFANEDEVLALFDTSDLKLAIDRLRGICPVAAVTRGEKGCIVLDGESAQDVSTRPVAKVVDTTGAGDLFASGFLYGLTRAQDIAGSARLGNACAGEIIGQLGARSLTPLNKLVA